MALSLIEVYTESRGIMCGCAIGDEDAAFTSAPLGMCCDAEPGSFLRFSRALIIHAMHSYMLDDIVNDSMSLAYPEWEKTSASAGLAVDNESTTDLGFNDWGKSPL